MVEMEKRTYRLTGFTPMLGSSPADPYVRTNYIASKAPDPVATAEEEREYLLEREENKITVFLRNPKSGALMLLDYQVMGFIKGSLESLTAQTGIKAPRGKVDKYVFVSPRRIDIRRADGSLIREEDEVYERPLRAMTMKGERVSLAASEQIHDPWQITFTVSLLPNERSKVSASIKWEDIERALDYGEMRGLGQFRNGGYGRFTWERVDDQEEEKVKRHGA